MKKTNKAIFKSIYPYIAAFFIPALLLFLVHILFQSGYGTPLIGVLSPSQILWNGLASVCFFFYIRHTAAASRIGLCWQLMVSFAYGLCSYGILQESSVSALCLYAIFPLVFLSFEQMISGKKYFPFLCMAALAFIINPACVAPIFLLFFLLTFLEAGQAYTASLGNILHRLSCLLLSLSLGALRIIPYFHDLKDSFQYSGFFQSYSIPVFLSRFLPGSAPSIAYSTPYGIDLYFGFFFLLLFLLFFFCKTISSHKRLSYGIMALLLAASLEFSTVTYVSRFFAEPDGYSLVHSFLLVFWCLKLAAEAISHFKDISFFQLGCASAIASLVLAVCWLFSSHNFSPMLIPSLALLFAFMLTLLFLFKSKRNRKYPQMFLFLLIFIEFFANTLISPNLDFLASGRNTASSCIWDNPTNTETETSDSNKTTELTQNAAEDYRQFVSTHTADQTLINLVNDLQANVSLDASEIEKYCGKKLPNQLERLNGLCHKIGCKEDLFLPADASVSFEESDSYTIVQLADSLYYFLPGQQAISSDYYIPFHLQAKTTEPGDIYAFCSYSGSFFHMNPVEQSDFSNGFLYFFSNQNIGYNFELLIYKTNDCALEQLPALLEQCANEQDAQSQASLIRSAYVGFGISCVSLLIMLTLFFNSDKQKVYQVLLSYKKKLSHWRLPLKLAGWIKHNRIYYLSFFIPVCLFISAMIITNCTPFGNYSFYTEDGVSLTLPSNMDLYYNLKEGNAHLSMTGGYGSSIYATNPLASLFSYYRLFSPGQIAPLLLFGEAICLGLCGFSMVFYMTHRLHGRRARKEDYRLLIPAMIYALNSYMLAMHNYTGWFLTLFALPLLITAMDYLMYKKQSLPYVLLLTYCIFTNLYLALYICIFLVIYFFTCHFENAKDFIKKGIRFAFCSILAAGNSFFVISNTLFSSQSLAYQESDSIFPSIGLHTSFLEQWKKHMIFPSTLSVTADDGVLNIYCGILTLLLVCIYFFAKHISLREKARKLIPILLLYVSFNEQVLSYLWNGLHYQTKVPNRFAFLLLFLLAELSYDGICQLRKLSVRQYCSFTIILAGFFLICHFFSSGVANISLITTCILLTAYALLNLLFARKKYVVYSKSLVILFLFELSLNMLYTAHGFSSDNLLLYGDYVTIGNYINKELDDEYGYFRAAFPVTTLANTGQMYHAGSNSLFNSFVTLQQNNLNTMLGFYSGGNLICTNYASTPFSMSLCNNRYLFLPTYATGIIEDLEYYRYLGPLDAYYVFENPNALSLGIYAPNEAARIDSFDFSPEFFNDFVSLYTNSPKKLYTLGYLSYNEAGAGENQFYFTDAANNRLSLEEAEMRRAEARATYSFRSIQDLRIHLNYTPNMDGFAYFCAGEFVCLGKSAAGTDTYKNIPFPDGITEVREDYNFIVMDDAVLMDFYEQAGKNQLKDIKISQNSIIGATDYEKDGYTMLSLAYDRNWHAYVDGREIAIENPYDTFIMVKTPAGKHTLELKYIPYGMKVSKGISYGFFGLTLIIYITAYALRRRKTFSLS
ncbi:MAG: YfhO family protein [Roseburia sp.]|nr:YfhO family protein [Roseburia sp.]MCM1278073.1 YfhO family protein [Robinsoniella sp.]